MNTYRAPEEVLEEMRIAYRSLSNAISEGDSNNILHHTNSLLSLAKEDERVARGLFEGVIYCADVEVIRILLDADFPRHKDKRCIEAATDFRYSGIEPYMVERKIEIFSLFLEKGFSVDKRLCRKIAEKGCIVLLRLLKKYNLFSNLSLTYVYRSDDRECIIYAIEEGISYDYECLCEICESDDMEVIRMLHERGVFQENRYVNSGEVYSRVQSIEMLKYLYEAMKISWDETTYINLYSADDEMKEYLLANNCPMTLETSNIALDNNNLDVVMFLHEHGCPFDPEIPHLMDLEDHVGRYYHDNFYNKTLCKSNCVHCFANKLELLGDIWILIDTNLQNCVQWLPREILDDVIDLCDDEGYLEEGRLVRTY